MRAIIKRYSDIGPRLAEAFIDLGFSVVVLSMRRVGRGW
jgi:hypothetical protein